MISTLLNNLVAWILLIFVLLAIPPSLIGVVGAGISILNNEMTGAIAYALLSLASVQIGVLAAKLYQNWTS